MPLLTAMLVLALAPQRISAALGGDLMVRDQGVAALDVVAPTLSQADWAFVNLEGALSDHPPPPKQCHTHCFALTMPQSLAPRLAQAGIDVVSQANNHAKDAGWSGMRATAHILHSSAIASTGPMDQPPAPTPVPSWVVLAYAPNAQVQSCNDVSTMQRQVRALVAQGQQVVVSMHAGAEGVGAMHVRPGPETTMGEVRCDPLAFSHAAIDAGAVLVVGHGPHVPRALDWYRNHLILLSLGNFITDAPIKIDGVLGQSILVWAEWDRQGQLQCLRLHSYRQSRTPPYLEPDPTDAAATTMWSLTQQDRPQAYAPLQALAHAPCLRAR